MASPVAAEWARSRPPAHPATTSPDITTPTLRDPAPHRPPTHAAATSPDPTALVLGDPAPHLARALEDSGHTVTRWHRFLTRGQLCTPWPPPGPFDEVWVRMPRSSLEAAMLLHAAAARVADGARVHLFGANSEGIRSAARHFPPGTDPPRAALVKRRCRVLVATRRSPPPRPDGLDNWEVRAPVDWGTGERRWTFYPGVFACGRLDPATALLIDRLPTLPAGARVLDFGAGTGPVAAAALERGGRGAEVVLLDPDAISLAAAARNVPGGTMVPGDGIGAVEGPFDLIASNPPVHAGRTQSLRTVEGLARDAPGVLAPGGTVMLVAQRRLPVARLLESTVGDVRTVGDRGPFRVWEARGARGTPVSGGGKRAFPSRDGRSGAVRRRLRQPYRPSM